MRVLHLKHLRLALAACFALLGSAGIALAEPRVALIIGNSSYGGDLGQLPNPANDARLMAKTLTGIGFTVIVAENADQAQMKRVIQDFGQKLAAAGAGATGLFFYAGHGLQVAGTNYLIPIHARIAREPDVEFEAVAIDLVMKQMDYAEAAVSIVILDACRNNPLSRGFRSVSRGLADPSVRPMGSFIAYSTAPGDVAEDGKGANSPYTTALAESIVKPGASINDIFQEVRGKVLVSTGKKQVPWDSSSLTAPFYFVPAAQTNAIELAFWDSIKESDSVEDYQAYLRKYPDGTFSPLAMARLKQAATAEAAAVSGPVSESAARAPEVAPAATAPQIVATSAKLYVRAKARLRAAPSTEGSIVGSLPPATPLEATGRTADDQWWRVQLSDGRSGFIAASLVTDRPPVQAAPAGAVAIEATETAAKSTTESTRETDACIRHGDASDEAIVAACKRVLAGSFANDNERYDAHVHMGHALLALDRVDEAMKMLQDAIAMDPDFYFAHYWVGRVHFSQSDYAAAGAAFDRAIAADPKRSEPLAYRGAVGWRTGDFDSARADIQRALAIDAESEFALNQLTYIQLHAGDVAGAVATTDRVRALDPELYSSGWFFADYIGGRYANAVAIAERGMKADPHLGYWWLWKAMAQRAGGDKAGATATLADARNRFDKNDWVMDIAAYLGGNLSERELRNRGRSDSEQAEFDCEIGFYVGDQKIFEGDPEAARAALAAVAETRIYRYPEYMAAPARLARLQ